MLKKVVILSLLFFGFISFNFGVDISSCQTINSGGTYTLTQNIVHTSSSDCFPYSTSDPVIIDLNGFNVTGPNGYFFLDSDNNNQDIDLTIRNGHIKNWNTGVFMRDTNGLRDGYLTIFNVTFSGLSSRNIYALGGPGDPDLNSNTKHLIFDRVNFDPNAMVLLHRVNRVDIFNVDVIEASFFEVNSAYFNTYNVSEINTSQNIILGEFINSYNLTSLTSVQSSSSVTLNGDLSKYDFFEGAFPSGNICRVSLTGFSNESFNIRVSKNLSVTGMLCIEQNLFGVGVDSVVLDLNGKTITGPGTSSYNFLNLNSVTNRKINFTVFNGEIKDFYRGLFYGEYENYNASFRFKDLVFTNLASDNIYVDGSSVPADTLSSLKEIYFENVSFDTSKGMTFNQFDDVYFLGYSSLNFSSFYFVSSNFHAGDVKNFTSSGQMNLGQEIVYYNFSSIENLGSVSNTLNLYGDYSLYDFDSSLGLENVCTTRFLGSSSSPFKVSQNKNISISDDCLFATDIDSNVYSLEVDLKGNTITTSSNENYIIFSGSSSNKNLNVSTFNGVLDNLNYGAYFSNTGNYDVEINFDDVSFTNVNQRAMYFSGGDSSYNKKVKFSNSNLSSSSLQLLNLNSLLIYGNHFSSANSLLLTNVLNLNTSLNPSQPIGNYWGDFGCSDLNDNYSVFYNNWNYTICNSDDYLVNSITDVAPILSFEYVEPVDNSGSAGGSGQSGSVSVSNLPGISLSSILIGFFSLFLFFIFN